MPTPPNVSLDPVTFPINGRIWRSRYTDERCTVYSGPLGLISLPPEAHMKAVAPRKDHVFVVSHVHVHEQKVAELLVKAATLLPHCRAEKGNVYANLYRETASAGVPGPPGSEDDCAFVWM